ncbi:TonB-dependent receptor [Daejeonella sp.]|uniref:SusC/RagA family TonB-linked outer membrane protein n=1 Tax=Daejeonella sp. TaxID=2805397 RepID=UPI0030C49358
MKLRLLTLFLCLFILTVQTLAQQKTINGRVTDENSQPLPGVSVKIKGTNSGTSTGIDGSYSITVNQGQTLVFSFLGTTPQEHTVGNGSSLNVSMIENQKSLQEVVIVGYGTQKKADLTGAVSTIDVQKTLGTRPITDLARGLQGAAPGLTITTQSGAIGKNPHIRLRGMVGSLNGGGAEPLVLLDNVEVQNLQMVNPDDIETISVLKDAASASIYGTRAAWGVILITSKSGKKNMPSKISYSNNFSSNAPTSVPEIASAAGGAEMALAALRRRVPGAQNYSILGASFDDESVKKMREWEQLYGGQDLGDEMVLGRDFEMRGGLLFFYRPWDVGEKYLKEYTPQQKHNISVSAGGDKTSYNLGLSYLGQEGVLKVNPDKFVRYNISLGLNSKINSWFDARAKMIVANTNTTQPYFRLNPPISPWYNVYRYPQTYPYGTYQGKPFRNIITEVEQAQMDGTKSNLSRIQVGGTVKVIPGLTIDGDYTYSSTNSHFRSVGGPTSGIDFWTNSLTYKDNFQPAVTDRLIYTSNWNEINTGKLFGTYTKNIKNHSVKLIAGGDIEYFEATGHGSTRQGLLVPSQGEISLATGDQLVSGSRSHWSTLGSFGRINYSFKDKYLLEMNGRFDGSSRFPKQQQWGFFPSMSAGYIVTNEPFMDFAKPVLSFLKIRGSYGSIGNQDVGAYRFLSIISAINSNWWVNGNNQRTVTTPGALSPSLTWETISTLDLGLDARVLNDQIGISFDWYRRTTSDMITGGITLPNTFGAASPVRNYGEMQTVGWELALNWDKAFDNGIKLNMSGSLSDFREKLTKFANATMNINANYQGKFFGEIWGYETDRFFTESDFNGQDANGNWIPKAETPNQSKVTGNVAWFRPSPGDIKYKDLNGDGKVDFGANTVGDHGDLRVIGNSTPRYQYGLRLGADYKGFDFSTFVQGVGKRQDWPSGPNFIPGFQWNEAWYSNQEDYWTPQNRDAFYPRPTDQVGNNSALNFNVQTKYLLDMAYARMKNITLGYTIPQKWSEKIKMNSARLYLSGENLFELNNLTIPIDPEIDYTDEQPDARSFNRVYPYQRTYSFGLQVTL